MNKIKNLRVKKVVSGLMILMLTGVPLLSTSNNSNTKQNIKDGRSYITAYDNKIVLPDDSILWIDIDEQQGEIIKKKKKVLNKYF